MNYSRRQLEAFGEPLGESVTQAKPGGRIYGGGGAPAQPTNTSISQTSIPDYAKPYVETMLGKTQALTSQPYQAYGGQRLADFSNLQNQAFQGVQNLQPSQQLGTATQMAGMSGLGAMRAGQQYNQMATDPNSTAAFMSPYIQNALAPQMEEARRQSGITGQQNASQAVGAGAFGGSRFGLQEAERQRNLGTQQSQIYGQGMQNAFQNAQQAQQFGANLGLQGMGQAGQMAATLGQLGQTQFGQQKDILNAQMNAGTQQQNLEQQRLSQQYQDFQNQRQYPYQQLGFMSDMLRGLPLGQQAQSMYQAPPTMAQNALALGVGAMGAKQAGLFAEGGSVGEQSYGLGGIALHQLG